MTARTPLGRVAGPGQWRAEGACASSDDPDAWFAGADEPGKTRDTARRLAAAVDVCRGCPVLDECRDYALRAGEVFGVWGGLLPTQRRRMRARNRVRADVGAVPPQHGTLAAYRRGCRCDGCRGANTEYKKRYQTKGAR